MSNFEIRRAKNHQFYFVLKGMNGHKIFTSEMYESLSSCEKGIQAVIRNAQEDKQFRRITAQDGSFYFTLLAKNGEVVGTSDMYTTIRRRDQGLELVQNTLRLKDTVS